MGMGQGPLTQVVQQVTQAQTPVQTASTPVQAPQMDYGTFQQPASYQPPPSQPMGKGGNTYSPLSGQPRVGQPNSYANTVGMGDNASTQQPAAHGKGKGA